VEPIRNTIMTRVAGGRIDVPTATDMTEAVRWVKRVSWHISRIANHLDKAIF
jgi:phosphate:Na+ symporter